MTLWASTRSPNFGFIVTIAVNLHALPNLSAFRPWGVPGPTSKLSPRAPAQMGRRETEREGGKTRGRQA
jgi:hypothetical protein